MDAAVEDAAGRPGFLAWGLLLLMALVLARGAWQSHAVLSLALPAVAGLVWWPTLRANRSERWLLVYVTGIYLYTILRAAADEVGLPVRVAYVLAFDRWLFGGGVPSLELQRDFFSPWAVDWLDVLTAAVHASFFIVPHAALVLIWRRHPGALRAYVVAVLLTLYAALALFFLFPTVPPWLAGQTGQVEYVYRIIDFVFGRVEPSMYREFRDALAEPNSVAAVPSIHMAITCVVLFRAHVVDSRWTLPLLLYSGLMAFSLVYLGEHYVFDLVAGTLIAAVAEVAVRRRLASGAAPPRTPELVPEG